MKEAHLKVPQKVGFLQPGIVVQVNVLMCSIVSEALGPNGLFLPGSSVPEISQERTLEWVAFLLSRDLAGDPYPRIEDTSLGSPALAAGFFTMEPPENLVGNVEEIKMVNGRHGCKAGAMNMVSSGP